MCFGNKTVHQAEKDNTVCSFHSDTKEKCGQWSQRKRATFRKVSKWSKQTLWFCFTHTFERIVIFPNTVCRFLMPINWLVLALYFPRSRNQKYLQWDCLSSVFKCSACWEKAKYVCYSLRVLSPHWRRTGAWAELSSSSEEESAFARMMKSSELIFLFICI